ncbi:hypothetical protein ACN6IQ_02075 [Fannyhessea vaginae]|uniref:hypothetical protein n=1 Tax=Fannyhessea vaginae TaxID=82135 RepID=UPI003B2173B5
MAKEKDYKKILNLLKENKELMIMVPPAALTFLGVLYGIIRYLYSLNAEQFYGIPKFYFYDNLQVDYVMSAVFFMATIMLCFSPFMKKGFLKKNKLNFFEILAYSFLFAFFVFCLSLVFCVSFIINTLHFIGYDSVLLSLCILVAIISWVVYFFALKTDLTDHPNIDKQETEEDKNKEDAPDELKTKNIIAFALAIVTTTVIVIVEVLISNSTLFTPNNKKNYEIIQVGKSECNVIVGYYKDSAIIMKGKIDYPNSDLYSQLKIKKRYYKLESIEEKDLVYCGFDSVTCKD